MTVPIFDLARLMQAAEFTTGLNDWGGEAFKEPLRLFFDSLNNEAHLTEQGVARTMSHFENLFVQRLRLFDDRKKYPAIAEEVIREPLFMTGLPRAGTSFLNALIACDPSNIAPCHWQMWSPSPPPNAPDIDHSKAIARGHDLIAFEGWQDPDLRSKHSYGAMQAEEDSHLHEFSFQAGSFTFFWDVPAYTQYIYSAPRHACYQIEHMILQAMQLGTQGKRWVLKSPDHFMRLDALFAVFPDARIVVNHRDPKKIIASGMSLLAAHRRQFGNRATEQGRDFAIGFLDALAAGMKDMLVRRDDPAFNARFVDINYTDLEARPLEQVVAVYDRFGWVLSDAAVANIQSYVQDNRKGKFGGHTYSLDDCGITNDDVEERFGFYYDRFQVERER